MYSPAIHTMSNTKACNRCSTFASWIPDPLAPIKAGFWILVSYFTPDGVRTYWQKVWNLLLYPYMTTPQTKPMDVKQYQHEVSDLLYKKHPKTDELRNGIIILLQEVNRLTVENTDLFKRSELVTLFMAKNAKGIKGIENLNDPHSNTKLAERFERIFLDLWPEVLMNEQQKTELESIERLSSLMEKAHDKCVSLADDKIRDFAFLKKDDKLPTHSDHPDLYNERAIIGRTNEARNAVKQNIFDELFRKELSNNEKTNEQLKSFLDEFVECCWLMLVSAKPFVFTFDAVDKVLEDELERKFSVYCSMKDYKDKTKKNGQIVGLVWPEIDDNDGTQKKGKVLANDNEDIDTEEADESEADTKKDKKDNKDGEICIAGDRPTKPIKRESEIN